MRALTEFQINVLFVVSQNGPVSVADVAGHLLVDGGAARSRLSTLERHGLVARRYTGHHRGSNFAYDVTRQGEAALEGFDGEAVELAPGECSICGLTESRHMRACPHNPQGPRRPID